MNQNDGAVSGHVPAFFFWLLPIPVATLWTLWKLTQPNMNNAGYVLPALSIALVLGVFIAALVVALVTRTAGASLLGALASVPVAFAVGSITISQAQTQGQLHWQETVKAFQQLLCTAQSRAIARAAH